MHGVNPFTAGKKREHDPTVRDITPHEPPQLIDCVHEGSFLLLPSHFIGVFSGWLCALALNELRFPETQNATTDGDGLTHSKRAASECAAFAAHPDVARLD